ncbi:MAG TPA: hypothetical protein VLA45_10080 [Paracoccaceae bacterium]|nr:hypothetical protein [Paracoccaceae bacterium]
MKSDVMAIVLTGLMLGASPAAVLAQETTAASAAEPYSVSTTLVGTLLDDPAAAAVLEEIIPVVYANEMFQSMGRDQTLQAIQQYEPVALSNDNLAKIQAELDKLPPKE